MSSAFTRMVSGFSKMLNNVDFNSKIVADLGCGFGRWGHIIRSEVDKGGNNAFLIGCDAFRPSIEQAKKYSPYDELVICDIRHLPFKENTFDITIACEVIEHMEKNDGIEFISKLEELTREKVIISTPFGYFEQGLIRQNSFEIHKSGWRPQDFLKKGYQTLKCGLGVDMEDAAHKLNIYSLLNQVLYFKCKNKWKGTMLFATKTFDLNES